MGFDNYCRNHGGCSWCEGNRQYQKRREAENARQQMMELKLNEEQE